MTEFTRLPDLAARDLGGSVVAASDESFADKENLITPQAPQFTPGSFGPKGQRYDGWETRRRRDDDPAGDWALLRLGLPGVIRGVVIDTAWFTGNYPPRAAVDACAAAGYPSPAELGGAAWEEVVPPSPLRGDTAHHFAVAAERRFTHVRLRIMPDGGVARLRVHGEAVADPHLLDGITVDLAALANGAEVTDCSDAFYSSPGNMLRPGLARHQAEGWETARRRGAGNDWAVVRLAAPGTVRLVELDTTNLKFNAPAWAAVHGIDARRDPQDRAESWFPLLPRTRLQPDTPHRFRVDAAREATHARLDIYPDGGMARMRLHGGITPDGLAELRRRFAALGG